MFDVDFEGCCCCCCCCFWFGLSSYCFFVVVSFVSDSSCSSSCFALVVLLPLVSHRSTKHQAPHCNELGPNLKRQTGASLPGFVMKLYTLTLLGFAQNAWKTISNIKDKYIVFFHGHLNYHGRIRQKNTLNKHTTPKHVGRTSNPTMGLGKALGGVSPLDSTAIYPGSPTTICYSVP